MQSRNHYFRPFRAAALLLVTLLFAAGCDDTSSPAGFEKEAEEDHPTVAVPTTSQSSETTPETVTSSISTEGTKRSGKRVLLYHSDASNTYAGYVERDLVSTGLFADGDIDGRKMNGTPPSLEELAAYDCVVAWTNLKPPSPIAQGDRLREYVDAGGKVVLTAFAYSRSNFPFHMQGGIMEDGYSPLNPTSSAQKAFPRTLDFSTAQTAHPVFEGVKDFTYDGNSYFSNLSVDEDALLLGQDNRGVPLIAVSASGQVVGFNIFPRHFDRSGGVVRALANACAYDFTDFELEPEASLTADAGAPVETDEGSVVTFDASRSSHSKGAELDYEWDFGDGHKGTGVRPTHTYADDDVYTVTLTVRDASGLSGQANTVAVVNNVTPEVVAGGARALASGEAYVLEGRFADPGVKDAAWKYSVDWGDGNRKTGEAHTPEGALVADYRFCELGDYNVALDVTDKDEATGSDFFQLTVTARPLTVDILPGSDKNKVKLPKQKHIEEARHDSNSRKGGVLPVAVLTTPAFDAAELDPETVTLGNSDDTDTPVLQLPNGRLMAELEDVDDDGDQDLALKFSRANLAANGDLTLTTESLVLSGKLRDGCSWAAGSDLVHVIQPKGDDDEEEDDEEEDDEEEEEDEDKKGKGKGKGKGNN